MVHSGDNAAIEAGTVLLWSTLADVAEGVQVILTACLDRAPHGRFRGSCGAGVAASMRCEVEDTSLDHPLCRGFGAASSIVAGHSGMLSWIVSMLSPERQEILIALRSLLFRRSSKVIGRFPT